MQRRCNGGATEVQWRCNEDATKMQWMCNGQPMLGEINVCILANQSADRGNGPSNLTDLAWRQFQRRQPCEVTWIFRSADKDARQGIKPGKNSS